MLVRAANESENTLLVPFQNKVEENGTCDAPGVASQAPGLLSPECAFAKRPKGFTCPHSFSD